MEEKVTALIMAGGKGSRFWPLSREHRPKQFLHLDGGASLLERAYERACAVTGENTPYIAVAAEQTGLTMETLSGKITPQQIITEPAAKNTAAAVYWSALCLQAAGCTGTVAVFPADHQIENEKGFLDTIRLAAKVSEENQALSVIGIRPRYPATGFGYVERGKRESLADGREYFRVRRFVEKPHREKARRYLKKGTYFWNSGILVFLLEEIFNVYDQFLPEFKEIFADAAAKIGTDKVTAAAEAAFHKVTPVSFDVGILEKAKNTCLIEADFDWDDVGSYNSLNSLIEPDTDRNIKRGNIVLKDVRNSVIIGDNRLIAVIGLRDIVIVEERGVLLVCPRMKVEEIKDIVDKLSDENEDYL